MPQKKAAIGLSVSMLVVIILSLVILAGGITLLYQFLGEAGGFKEVLDARTKAELERLLTSQGKQVALPFNSVEIPRGESHLLGIGILNIGIGESFRLTVELGKLINENEEEIPLTDGEMASINQQWLLYLEEGLIIQEGEHRVETIMVMVPKNALKGTYIFNAKVLAADGQQYGNTQKFYVGVK